MDFSTAYFGKPLTQLRYDDVVNYFAEPKQETETIEFKSFHTSTTFDKALQGIIRGISAFLNSSGGILIWGALSGKVHEGLSEKVFVGDLAPLAELKEKDSLINKISGTITPLPIGIKVESLESNGQYVYVFEVQPSMYKPHQFDTRYYVRLDGQTKPAPHYLVDALMKQVTYPNLNGFIRFNRMTIDDVDAYHLPITIGLFNFTELQNDEQVSFRVFCGGGYFNRGRTTRFNPDRPHALYASEGQELIYNDFASVLHYGTPHIHNDHIVIDHQARQRTAGQLNLLLSFGGKRSPAKTSFYTLDFSHRNIALSLPDLIITEKLENVLISEHHKRLNTKPQDIINTFLRNT